MIRTNIDKLVMLSVQGTVSHQRFGIPFICGADGVPRFTPRTGAITYNVKVGDLAHGWAADHIEPGVSTILDQEHPEGPKNAGYNAFVCIGNEVRVVTGDAKGAIGCVTGKHGGAEHVIVDFAHSDLEKLNMDDKFLIKSYGQGMKFLDYPDIVVYNVSPQLLKKWNIKGNKDGTISVPVTKVVPGHLMGSGIGKISPMLGDYDIQTHDPADWKKYNLGDIRLGDLVAIEDHHGIWGRSYLKGSVSIGVILHGDSEIAGHGPGV
ncbi:DUF4438 domain-containing protein, partial [bacterium]|nr:DUF4438 domain-containing protein [bacterium]MBU1025811.1 DUF4438 domain-containing protein [bacterium]